MTRVIMIAPMLIILGLYLAWEAKRAGGEGGGKMKLVIPWFAVYFIGVAGFNSLHLLPENLVNIINEIDQLIDENRIRLIEKKDTWKYYNKIESTDTFIFKNHGLKLKKIYPLSTMYKIYKWNKDKGYTNFSTWLK